MQRLTGLVLLILCIATGCGQRRHVALQREEGVPCPATYAQGFRIIKYPDYTEVTVRNPWDTVHYLQRYLLVSRNAQLPDSLPEGTLIRTPLTRVATFSSIHCAMLQAIGSENTIAGVCEPRYILMPFIHEGIASGRITDLGEAFAPNIEKIMALAPEVLYTSPIKNSGYGRLGKAGIPLIECTEYMEAHPLGQAEWIRFHALFFEKEKYADSIFEATKARYQSLARLTGNTKKKPTVVAELKTGSVWYVPGGKSYMAYLYKDAGADYFWSDDRNSGSVPLSPEAVFGKAGQADIWLIKYNNPREMTYGELKANSALNSGFSAFRNRQVYACNTHAIPFYEEVILHPDFLLKDFIGIFHPELLPGYSLRYYKKMER